MSIQFSDLARQILPGGDKAAGDAARAEVEALFSLHRGLEDPDPDWCESFVASVTAFVIRSAASPAIDGMRADAWMIAQIDADGGRRSLAEFEALVRVVEQAPVLRAKLRGYALDRIERIVLSDEEPSCGCEEAHRPSVRDAAPSLVRRLLFADEPAAAPPVRAGDVERLHRMTQATRAHGDAAKWEVLLADCLSNYLDGFLRAETEPRALDGFVADCNAEFGRAMGAMLRGISQP